MSDSFTDQELLEAALAEQARLGERFEGSIGTAAELSSLARLQAANRQVAACQRAVDLSPDGRQQ